jgi:hypothetical protein
MHDFFTSLSISIGASEPSNWHYYIYSVLIEFFVVNQISLSILAVLQMLLYVFAVYYAVKTLYKQQVNFFICIAVSLVYSVYPPFVIFACSLNADLISFPLFLIYAVLLYRALCEKDFFDTWRNIIGIAVVCALMMMFRTQQIPIIIVTSLVALIYFRKHYEKIVIAFCMSMIIMQSWNFYSYEIIHVKESGNQEMMAIPIQMVGAIYARKGKLRLTKSERQVFKKINSEEKWKSDYIPTDSDPLRGYNRNMKVSPYLFISNVASACMRNKRVCLTAWWKMIDRYFTLPDQMTWRYTFYYARSFEENLGGRMYRKMGCDDEDLLGSFEEKITSCYQQNPNVQNKLSFNAYHKVLSMFWQPNSQTSQQISNLREQYHAIFIKPERNYLLCDYRLATYPLLALFAIVLCFRRRYFLIILPSILYFITLLGFTTLNLYRYIFPIFFVLPFLFIAICQTKPTDKS